VPTRTGRRIEPIRDENIREIYERYSDCPAIILFTGVDHFYAWQNVSHY
jgi:hypothetical protein